ncbi:AMP-binding protein [Erwinia psidii]|uniref:AMP-dependent synthetase n=1 Tax=Erwinia psidii TaxID=69224 RepID=A0A3N6SDM1_9GAMM|nr:AMP-binding protein [Erwinia psidii]MCX8957644.1 AMP-dependent synthetase [Erwinia psidii]MCX8960698.1 AMP-dependent synthetase [Erwinia psidii]MCX8964057.1 AMP-dependent synthetase [Erwinia psidii]RQM39540.1 AMP-dependent synthetase [Erwinia psidii]
MSVSLINDIVNHPPEQGGNLIVATLGGRRTIPLSELYEMAGRVANGLLAQGVRAGDTLGILADNCLEWVLLDLAALRIKVRTAGFDPGKFEATQALAGRYQLKWLFTDKPHNREAASLRHINEIAAFLTGQPAALPPVSYAADETTTVKFTSGSTGVPKGLAATVGSIDSSLRDVQTLFTHGPHDSLLVFLPLSLLQQRYWIYSALKFGHDTILTNYQSAFIVMPQLNPTVVMGVPAFFDAARRHIEQQDGDMAAMTAKGQRLFGNKIRYLWTGSAPADPGTVRLFHQIALPLFEGYGMNETCIVTKNHPAASRPGSVGQVLPEKRVEIDAQGAIIVHSRYPVNTRYLYAQPGASEKMFTPDGGVRTGDLGWLDEEGFLYIKGRADNVIVLDNGKKIDVQPIEARLKNSGLIAECVIFSPQQTDLVAVISPVSASADVASIAAWVKNANAAAEKDEYVARYIIASEPFTIENGLLSSQFKPLRQMIFERYQQQLVTSVKETVYAH